MVWYRNIRGEEKGEISPPQMGQFLQEKSNGDQVD